jgi:heavy metal translocating P-type ATPase
MLLTNRARLVLSVGALIAGLASALLGADAFARAFWLIATVAALVPLAVSIVHDLLRRRTGVDLIALLAMVSAILVGEYLAAAVIAVMLATGGALEEFANGRARRELKALVERAPRVAQRYAATGLETVDVNAVTRGDRLLVRSGDTVPADGTVAAATAILDESALTGESRLVEHETGEPVLSGTTNAGGAFDLYVTASASESTYAGIVRLVAEAESTQSPFVRLADRFAFLFLPLTLLVAGGVWLLSGDAVRFVAVLVVATPCPLILAAPIAIISGVSRAAHRGIIVKGGTALEALAEADVLFFDKTGTLTMGRPTVTGIEAHGTSDEQVLQLSASLNQASSHALGAALVRAAHARSIELSFPERVEETAGAGIRGSINGHDVMVGRAEWVSPRRPLPDWVTRLRRRSSLKGATVVYTSIDGELNGAFLLEDPIRSDSARTIRALRNAGMKRVVMLTGDRAEVAEGVALTVGVDQVLAERSPAEKVDAVKSEAANGRTAMVGDGINDAPALAVASVGVAMGARGAGASSEAADIVLVVDRLDRLLEAKRIAGRARRIAVESVLLGMGLSLIAMGFAAAGLLVPVAGALLQEGIDVIAILSALRALGGYERRHVHPQQDEMSRRFHDEHARLVPGLDELKALADELDELEPPVACARLKSSYSYLADELLPHEVTEEAEFYPIIAKEIGGEDPVGPMVRAHAEIKHFVRVLGQLIDDIPTSGVSPEDYAELRRVLYGLHAILRLHFAQEEEAYLSRADTVS